MLKKKRKQCNGRRTLPEIVVVEKFVLRGRTDVGAIRTQFHRVMIRIHRETRDRDVA